MIAAKIMDQKLIYIICLFFNNIKLQFIIKEKNKEFFRELFRQFYDYMTFNYKIAYVND